MSSARKLLVTVLTALLSMVALVLVSPASAQAASCSYPTFKYYPGSPTSKLRYAEVDFSFSVCSSGGPSSWSASVTKTQVNSTGKNLGFFIDGTSLRTTSSNSAYRYELGTISASSCLARVGWPCYRSYSFSMHFQLSGTKVKAYGVQVPGGLALFTTP